MPTGLHDVTDGEREGNRKGGERACLLYSFKRSRCRSTDCVRMLNGMSRSSMGVCNRSKPPRFPVGCCSLHAAVRLPGGARGNGEGSWATAVTWGKEWWTGKRKQIKPKSVANHIDGISFYDACRVHHCSCILAVGPTLHRNEPVSSIPHGLIGAHHITRRVILREQRQGGPDSGGRSRPDNTPTQGSSAIITNNNNNKTQLPSGATEILGSTRLTWTTASSASSIVAVQALSTPASSAEHHNDGSCSAQQQRELNICDSCPSRRPFYELR